MAAASDRPGDEILFYCEQYGDLIQARYQGGSISEGRLLAKESDAGRFATLYHHTTTSGELLIGEGSYTQNELQDGRVVLHKEWRQLCGDRSVRYSDLIESGEW